MPMDYLFKYTSAQGALSILQNLTVRWSSPLEFNDPFDSQLNISYGDTEYFRLIRQQIMREFGGEMPKGSSLGTLIDKWFLKNESELTQSKEEWKQYVKWVRIFSMTERNDDLLMWAHYAEWHRGAVFGFKTGGSFNPRKICYSGNIPKVGLTALDFAEDMSGSQKPFDYDNFFFENIFIKSKHWEYEQEWRCVDFVAEKDLNNEELIELRPVSQNEILSVYLGCSMEEKTKDRIILLAKQKVSGIKIYEAKKHESQFGLTFKELNVV